MVSVKIGQVWEIDDPLYSARFHVTFTENKVVQMMCFSITHKNVSNGYCEDFETGNQYLFTYNFYDFDNSWELIYDPDGMTFDNKQPLTCSKCNTINEYAEHDLANGPYICYRCRSGF